MGRSGLLGSLCAAALACGALLSCTSLRYDDVLQVYNRSKYPIKSIEMSLCGGDLDDGVELLDRDLNPHASRRIELPVSCVNLVATDTRGEVVGEQHELRIRPDSTWTIR